MTLLIIVLSYMAAVGAAAYAVREHDKKRLQKMQASISTKPESKTSANLKSDLELIDIRLNNVTNSMAYGNPREVPVGAHKSDLAIIDERLAQVKARFPEEIERRESDLRVHRWTMEQLEQERLDVAKQTQAEIRAEHLRQRARFSAWAVHSVTHK